MYEVREMNLGDYFESTDLVSGYVYEVLNKSVLNCQIRCVLYKMDGRWRSTKGQEGYCSPNTLGYKVSINVTNII